MRSLNLKNASAEGIENFITTIFEIVDKKSLDFTTGEYGLILFHKIISEYLLNKYGKENIDLEIPTYISAKVPENGFQYIRYNFANNTCITIIVDETLDINTNIDEETGFPIASQSLYFKQ